MNELADEAGAAALEEQLEQLRSSGAQQYDPAQFRYIEAMARRAQEQREAVGTLVRKSALIALEQYCEKFALAQNTAEAALSGGLLEFPQAAEQLEQHFDACDFSGLKQLLAKLQRATATQPLVDLVRHVTHSKPVLEAQVHVPSFDDILRKAERKLVNTVSDFDTNSDSTDAHTDEDELSSIHYFRESLVRRNADKLVTQAIREIPEGAGPLNSEKLIVQSLASMRDLSPHYLNRFVAYIDTLLWLEQAAKK